MDKRLDRLIKDIDDKNNILKSLLQKLEDSMDMNSRKKTINKKLKKRKR